MILISLTTRADAQQARSATGWAGIQEFVESLTDKQKQLLSDALSEQADEDESEDERTKCLKRCDTLYPRTPNENNLNKENRQECKKDCRDKFDKD